MHLLSETANHYQTKGLVERVYITSDALKNNIIDEYPGREILVYLPPSYYENNEIDYPVVYMLHGFGGTAKAWFTDGDDAPDSQNVMNELIQSQLSQEMILVAPDTNTRHIGSWYQNSTISGNWQDFIVNDLIPTIDQRFRTLDSAKSRGLLGHSMGGTGAFELAFDYPDLFSAVAPMSPAPALMGPGKPEAAFGFYEFVKPQFAGYTGLSHQIDFNAHVFLSLAQLFIPDASNPPTYIKANPQVDDFIGMSQFNLTERALNLTSAYPQIQWYSDMGNADELGPAEPYINVMQILQTKGLNLTYEVFDGGHTNKFSERMPLALKFMSKHLEADHSD